jgi:hypothetical protein
MPLPLGLDCADLAPCSGRIQRFAVRQVGGRKRLLGDTCPLRTRASGRREPGWQAPRTGAATWWICLRPRVRPNTRPKRVGRGLVSFAKDMASARAATSDRMVRTGPGNDQANRRSGRDEFFRQSSLTVRYERAEQLPITARRGTVVVGSSGIGFIDTGRWNERQRFGASDCLLAVATKNRFIAPSSRYA